MNQRTNGCRTFHRIGQPSVQRDLCGFTDRTTENKDPGDREPYHIACAELGSGLGENTAFSVERKRVEFGEQHHHADEHTDIADARRQKRLFAGVRCGVLFKPETDEQIGAETDEFPTDIDAEQVIRYNQEEH